MTELKREEEKFEAIKKQIEEKCAEGKKKVQALMLDGRTVQGEAWAEIVKNYYNYQIHTIKLMSVGKYEKQKTYYEQFMLTFENDDTVFIYIDLK